MVMAMMFFGVQAADATAYYYVGGAWGLTTSWDTGNPVACTPGAGGGVVPTPTDTIIFDADCDTSVNTPVASTTVAGVTIDNGYSGTVGQSGPFDSTGVLSIGDTATWDTWGWGLTVGGDYTNAGVFNHANNTVTFDGISGNQAVITGGTTGDFDFYNVIIDNSGDQVTLTTNGMTVNNDLSITNGSNLFFMGVDLTVSSTFSNEGGIALKGDEIVTLTEDTNSGSTTFLFTSTGSFALAGLTSFFDVTFADPLNQTITWTMVAPIDVNGDFTISGLNATLNANGNDINVAGEWNNNSGNFTSGLNTVTFDGSATQAIGTGGTTTNKDFNNIVISNTGDAAYLDSSAIDIDGNMTISSGSNFATDGNDTTVGGTFSNEGTFTLEGSETTLPTTDTDSGTVTYDDSGAGTHATLAAGYSYFGLSFTDNSSGSTWNMTSPLNVDQSIFIGETSTLASGGNDITVAGDWDLEAGAFYTHANNLVTFDGTAQVLAGDTTFYDLTKSAASTDTLTLTTGDTFTVTNDLVLNGASGAVLSVETDVALSTANLDVNGTATVSYLSVKDITSAGSATPVCLTGCTNRNNNVGWTFASVSQTNPDLLQSSVTSATLNSPNGGESFDGWYTTNITWSVGGDAVDAVRLSYSVDNGQTYTVIATDEDNDGTYLWVLPNVDTTKAMVKVTGITSAGSEVISDTSNQSFTINFNPDYEVIVDETPPDQQVLPTVVAMTDADGNEVNLVEGSLFRGVELSGVYYVKDGTRYVFPNEAVFFSHGYSFDDVVTVKDDQLRKLMVGGRMIMAEGTMIKIQSDNKTYQVQADGVLAHVPDEATAIALYGPTWNKQITDISVAFWFDYTVGSALASQQ